MTKPITIAAIMQQVEHGRIGLDQPAGDILPELNGRSILVGFDGNDRPIFKPSTKLITIRQLITHTSGFAFPYWNALLDKYYRVCAIPNTDSCTKASIDVPLVCEPGDAWIYGISIAWIGLILEKVTGKKLSAYFAENIFGPLRMRDTTFKVKEINRLMKVYKRQSDGRLLPMNYLFQQGGEFESADGGLYSTAPDYLAFLQMLLNRGTVHGVQVLKPETVALMCRNQIGDLQIQRLESYADFSKPIDFYPDVEKKWGFNFLINNEKLSTGRNSGSIFWCGSLNSFFWVDFTEGITGVFATQINPFCDEKCFNAFNNFESAVYRALAVSR